MENKEINEESLKNLYDKVLKMKMDELFSEPYDPPEDIEDIENID
jgi:hypothetical protein